MKKLVIALIVILCTVAIHFGHGAVQGMKKASEQKVAQLNF